MQLGWLCLPAILLLALVCTAPDATAKMTYRLNDTVRTGFNALDYVLQRPLGNESFEHKRFGDRLFINGGVGVSMMGGTNHNPGVDVEAQFGDWITPVHGWRIGGNVGLHSVGKNSNRAYFGALSADYLMNVTSLLRGYNPRAKFQLIGALGIEYQRIRHERVWHNEVGFRAGLQARFNVSPALYLYAEPRLTLLAGNYFGSGDSYRRFRPDLSLHLGLGYRLLRGEERAFGATDFVNVDDNHMFFGGGFGLSVLARTFDSDKIGPIGSVYVGKWFSSVAGIRMKAQAGRYGLNGEPDRRYVATGAIDYVWNITSAFGGYRPNEVFGLNLNLGVAAAYGNKATRTIYPGVEGSLTASFRLSPNWSIYIEPQVQLFTRKFSREVANRGAIDPIATVMAGVNYTIGNFLHDFPESYEEYARSKHYFLTFSLGPAGRLRGDYGTGFALTAGFGKRFTPLSSWRITADGEIYRRQPGYVALALSADYICSISTSMAGYNDERVFDLSGVLGVVGGIANYVDPVQPVIGGKVGLLGSFRLTDALSLNIEPQLLALYAKGARSTGWTPEIRLMVGLNYRLGRSEGFAPGALDDSPLEGRRNFVSLSGGPTVNSSTLLGSAQKVNGAFDATIGRWFNPVSGARAGIAYDFVPASGNRSGLNMGTIHADYLFNITSLITRNADRRFHIIGLLGGGLAFSDATNSSAGLMVEGGLQFRYNLPRNIDIHIEPNAGLYMHRVMPNFNAHKRVVGVGRVLAGVSYRF